MGYKMLNRFQKWSQAIEGKEISGTEKNKN